MKHPSLRVVTYDEEWEDVDAVIVTPVSEFISIKKEVDSKISTNVISLLEMLEEIR